MPVKHLRSSKKPYYNSKSNLTNQDFSLTKSELIRVLCNNNSIGPVTSIEAGVKEASLDE